MSSSEPYRIELTRRAEKDLDRLRGLAQRAASIIANRLRADPEAGHTLSGSLRGYRSLEFSMPGGAYRAAYRVYPEERTCLIVMVGPHEGFNDRLRRRVD